jgi:hypothetical protein
MGLKLKSSMCRNIKLGLYDIVHYQQQSTHQLMEEIYIFFVKINYCWNKNIKWHCVQLELDWNWIQI